MLTLITIISFLAILLIAALLAYFIYPKAAKYFRPERSSGEEAVFVPSREDLGAFVGANSDYYLSKWDAMEKTGRVRSWNWSAALFTFFWMVYRKMYALAAVTVVAGILVEMASGALYTLFWLAAMICAGFYGDFLYYVHAVRGIAASKNVPLERPLVNLRRRLQGKRETKETAPETEETEAHDIARKGGTVRWLPAVSNVYLLIYLSILIFTASLVLTLLLVLAKKPPFGLGIIFYKMAAAWGIGPAIVVMFLATLLMFTVIAYLLSWAVSFTMRPFRAFAPSATSSVVIVMFFIILMTIAMMIRSCETVRIWSE